MNTAFRNAKKQNKKNRSKNTFQMRIYFLSRFIVCVVCKKKKNEHTSVNVFYEIFI